MGVVHIGPRPTFGKQQLSIECHLFDFDQTVAEGTGVQVQLQKKIRNPQKFHSSDALVTQIKQDIEVAKQYLKKSNS